MQEMEMKIQMELRQMEISPIQSIKNPLSHENKEVKNYILTSQNDVDI